MKSLIAFSSRTGNTKKVAEAVFQILPAPKEIFRVEDAPLPDKYDFIALGFWVDKGTADAAAQCYFNKVQEKNVGLFGTLGAYPDSDHARKCLEKVKDLLQGNEILGSFLSQGKVDPTVVKMMEKRMKDDPHHAMTPERRARLKEAEKHPDAQDCRNAQQAFKKMIEKLHGRVLNA